jgi:hypothetical protein
MPEHTDSKTAEKISVRFPIGIPYGRPLTADEGYWISPIGLDNDLVSLGNNVLIGHVCAPICGDRVARPLPGGKRRLVR